MLKRLRHAEKLRLALVTLVLVGFALAGLMSVSPDLHQLLHHDANNDEHECLVTVLHHGGCEGALPAPLLTTVNTLILSSAVPTLHPQWVEPLFLTNCVLEHAPPVMG